MNNKAPKLKSSAASVGSAPNRSSSMGRGLGLATVTALALAACQGGGTVTVVGDPESIDKNPTVTTGTTKTTDTDTIDTDTTDTDTTDTDTTDTDTTDTDTTDTDTLTTDTGTPPVPCSTPIHLDGFGSPGVALAETQFQDSTGFVGFDGSNGPKDAPNTDTDGYWQVGVVAQSSGNQDATFSVTWEVACHPDPVVRHCDNPLQDDAQLLEDTDLQDMAFQAEVGNPCGVETFPNQDPSFPVNDFTVGGFRTLEVTRPAPGPAETLPIRHPFLLKFE